MAKTTIKGKRGQKPITFNKGGLHRTTHTPAGQKIPAEKVEKAARGDYGALGVKQASLAKGALATGRRTAAANRRKRRKS